MAGGFCPLAPVLTRSAMSTSANTAPATGPTPSSLPIPAAQRVDAQALAHDTEQRGWINEAECHHKLIARLDALIADTEASIG